MREFFEEVSDLLEQLAEEPCQLEDTFDYADIHTCYEGYLKNVVSKEELCLACSAQELVARALGA